MGMIKSSMVALFCMAGSVFAAGIEWDASTLRLVAAGGNYARIIRLHSGELLCCYERGGACRVIRSRDNGNSWADEVMVTDYAYGGAANPELCQLNDGRVLLCYNERPSKTKKGPRYSIMMKVSSDQGKTWGKANRIFEAGNTFQTGCWEPVVLQYPDGEVQIFFANEKSYKESGEQEISMVSTRKPSKVWTVSFRENARDGMPVPCLLNDGETVAMVIEDSKWNDQPGKMKPVILFSTVEQRWKEGAVPGSSPRRQYALKEPLPEQTYLGAPYLVQMPSGPTVLSAALGNGDKRPQMAVFTGNERARDFENRSKPFAMNGTEPNWWNSLFVKDENTVTAVSNTMINGQRGIWIIDGKIK
ncbi:sialidase family protein [Pontiellaceae bacterium B12227]|nr:sialidase family protein [Pontiellaceae bacterium B12227]